jgi:hypothetical protein
MIGLGGRLQPRQSLTPEVVEELAQLGETFRSDPVQAPGAVAAFVDQPGAFQHPQVLRDGGAGNVEVRRNGTRAQLVVANEPQDVTASGLGQRPYCFHANT